jgi:hypothetical protein
VIQQLIGVVACRRLRVSITKPGYSGVCGIGQSRQTDAAGQAPGGGPNKLFRVHGGPSQKIVLATCNPDSAASTIGLIVEVTEEISRCCRLALPADVTLSEIGQTQE